MQRPSSGLDGDKNRPAPVNTDGLMVYIVDDNASVRQALARLVRSAGLRADAFDALSELVTRASLAAPDCAIADIRMPGTSGLELLGVLRD